MNREIKFRAWVTQAKKMIDLKAITPLACDPGLLEHGDGLFIPFREDILLMQYTGLKDKNGKEIYEGDILKWSTESGGVWDKTSITKVTFDNGCFVALLPLNQIAYKEIIGNIYENPTLIK